MKDKVREILKALYVVACLDVLDKKKQGSGAKICEDRIDRCMEAIGKLNLIPKSSAKEYVEIDEEKLFEAMDDRVDYESEYGYIANSLDSFVLAILKANPLKIRGEK